MQSADGADDRAAQAREHGKSMAMLEVNDIHTFYGHIQALKGISLRWSRARSSP